MTDAAKTGASMQLQLSVGDEVLTIDVQANDTFQDISERLTALGIMKVDINHLKSSNNDKPFNLSTNVIDYFTSTSKDKCDSHTDAPEQLSDALQERSNLVCRLCGGMIASDPQFLFGDSLDDRTLAGKVNFSLPIHVTKKDSYPKQVCRTCLDYLDKSYDLVKTVMEAEAVLECCLGKSDLSSHVHKEGRCPMCNNGHLKALNRKSSHGPSFRKGNLDKPVTVQVPKSGNSIKSTGLKRSVLDEVYKSAEYYDDDEVITGYWEPKDPSMRIASNSSPSSSVGTTKKYKKRVKSEDDQDWTIDEEYIPVSRRGRPKGTKNKPKVTSVIEKICLLCQWTGADLDMLAHTINLHCQPDLGYFPCPLCKTSHANEMILEAHIEDHNTAARSDKA